MSRLAVAGPSSIVTDTAIRVAREGGSVVDVAIVAILTAICTEPGVCAPGSGGFLTVALPGHDPVVIDGYVAVPGKGFSGREVTEEVTMTYGGGLRTVVGAGSVAVPGAFAALELAWKLFGTMPWQVLMDTVADVCDAGFPLSFSASLYLSQGADVIYCKDPASRRALFEGDTPKTQGASVNFEGLGDTLREIGREGAATFYRGDVGQTVVNDLQARGGQLTLEDLETYEAVARAPTETQIGTMTLATAPTMGGAALRTALELGGMGEPSDAMAGLIEAFRMRHAGQLSPSTVSVAAGDSDGGAVAASFSAGYGSGLIPAGTGLLMNNCLGELELNPDAGRGLTPGDRLVSNMAPSVLRGPDTTVALGTPGADRITSALAFTLSRLASGDSLAGAIDAPRAHPEFADDGIRIAAEPGVDVSRLGYPLRAFDGRHMFFGGVNGAGVLKGELTAHADPRRVGSVTYSD